MTDKPIISVEGYVDQLTRLGIWNDSQRQIAYAFLDQRPTYTQAPPNFAPFTAAQRAATERAFALISEVANLSFVQVSDNRQEPGPQNQRITFYAGSWDALVSGATSPYQLGGAPPIYGADIFLNNFHIARRTTNEGFFDFNFYVTLHEALHAIGLSHPGEYNGPGYNYADHAQFAQDTRQYSVMSYWNALEYGADHYIGSTQYIAQTPLLLDILSLQTLYGANQATRAGDTIYGFNSNTGQSPFNFAVNPNPVVAIWDAGGTDTLDLSGYPSGVRIDLHSGGFSDTAELTRNVAIAYGARIENGVGGAGNDVILLGGGANRVWGGAGADVFAFQAANDGAAAPRRPDRKTAPPDRLEDFVSGSDRIDLSAIDADRTDAADDAFAYIGSAAFSHVAGQVRWEARGGRAHILADLDGDAVADMHVVTSSATLQAADFIL